MGLALHQTTPIFAHDPPNSASPLISQSNQHFKESLQSQSEIRSKLLSRLRQERREATNSENVELEDKRQQISFPRYPRDTGSSVPVEDKNTLKNDARAAKSPRLPVEECAHSDDDSSNCTSINDTAVLEAKLRARARLQARLAAEKRLGKPE